MAEDQVPEVQAPAKPAQHAKYPWPAPSDAAVIGKPTSRVDGPVKVTGRAKYTYDINRPGMLHGRIDYPDAPDVRRPVVEVPRHAAEPSSLTSCVSLLPSTRDLFS